MTLWRLLRGQTSFIFLFSLGDDLGHTYRHTVAFEFRSVQFNHIRVYHLSFLAERSICVIVAFMTKFLSTGDVGRVASSES